MGEVIRRAKNGKFLGYYLRFYEGGRRRIIASKQTSHSEARRMLLEIEARIARGEVGIAELPPENITVAELIERFVNEYSKPRVKDIGKYKSITRYVLKRVIAAVGRRVASEVTQKDLARFRDQLCKDLAANSVCAVFTRLSAVYSWAVREGLVKTNPCRGVERPRSVQSVDFFSRDEVQQLLVGSEKRAETSRFGMMLHVGICIAAYTGLRKGELLGLRWSDLDLNTLRLTVARSYRTTPKGGRERHLRIPTKLVPLLIEWRKSCPKSPENLVIPIGRNHTRAARSDSMLGLPGLMEELGMRKVLHPWHLLRHTFASHFVMAGGNILALQKILGHSDVKMTMIYAHLAPDFLGQEMERVDY